MNIAALTFASLLFSASPAFATPALTLSDIDCPYAKDDIPEGQTATCHRMTWSEDKTRYSTTVAVFTSDGIPTQSAPIIYIPGGPGDAPVNEGADITSILGLLPQRTVVTLNPRGVKGAEPQPTCEFDPDFWDEDLSRDREIEITTTCRDAVPEDMTRFDAPYLAQDIARMVEALKFDRAGLFGISYGTESALHLLAQQPDWLDIVILDSVSLPGALGTLERLQARDRFLGVIDRLCFAGKGCGPAITDQYDDLMEWVAQFDEAPVDVKLGPDDKPWSLDGQDMLDFLASMSSYPDGAGYGPVFIEAFEDSPKDTAIWVDSEMEAGFEYGRDNFALLYGAFSDSAERNDPVPTAKDTVYPFKVEDYQDFAHLFETWNREDHTEPRFINATTERERVSAPVLVLSGGVDSSTPLSWALELDKRFSGLTHFVFPELAHAVAFGTDADVDDKEVARQLNCGPDVLRAFVAGKDYGDCEQYLRKANND